MSPASRFYQGRTLKLHYLEYPAPAADAVPLILLHGLTANGYAFNGLVHAGLAGFTHLICPDLRGRGLSEHAAFEYTVADHAADILALMDDAGLQRCAIGGHSYGALLSAWLCATHPERFSQVVLLDAAITMNPRTAEMLGPALARLDIHFPSWADYLEKIKSAPYNTFWEDSMEAYYRHDVAMAEDGSVEPRPNLAEILQVAQGTGRVAWAEVFPRVAAPALLCHGVDDYTLDMPLLRDEDAKETVAVMPDARYVAVDGNHQTMLYGRGAAQIVGAIRAFLRPGL